MDLNTLYGVLRAQLLSRHFALGRYFRADYPSYYNNLGVVHQASAGKRLFYLDGARHVHALSVQPDGSWADADLVTVMGAPAGAGTGLSGCRWADGSEQVFYLDASGDVHELSMTPDSQWADLDLTKRTGAPAAVANSALSAYQWAAGDSLQVVYLDAVGHVHELSVTAGGQWAHTDLTEHTGAPAAESRSSLSGYQWTEGDSKQVVYLDAVGHVHELSVTAGGQWAHTDLTEHTGAPIAWTLSSLPGYQWVAGKSKQVVYLDAAGHVHELSGTMGGRWAHTDLTQHAGAPVAGARSRLSGYEWADGKSKQVVYLDADAYVHELSVTVGGQWADANLTQATGAPSAGAGRALSGYQWAGGNAKQVVYLDDAGNVSELSVTWDDQATPPGPGAWAHANLTLLSRGPAAAPGSPLPSYEWPDDTENALAHGCLWASGGAVLTRPTTMYTSAADLQALPADRALFERWRVSDHQRANPLMFSGQLMACLAVETALGLPGSKDILSRLLATTKSLFKYSTPPYDGYILRWDPVTSDHWTTWFDEMMMEATNFSVGDCCDFLIDSDRLGGYAYCTQLDDPRYVPYISQSAFDQLSVADKNNYYNARRLSLDMTRYWEPSLDELTGLVAGYAIVNAVVSDPDIKAQVSDQATRLAGYLAANAYFLVRPEGGFCAQGAQAMAPALEFPFGRVFGRITGSEHAAQTDFEGALRNARLYSELSTALDAAAVAGPAAALLLAALVLYFGGVLGGILGAIIQVVGGVEAFIGLVTGGSIAKAAALYLNKEAFDVYSWPGAPDNAQPYPEADHNEQTAFALAYLIDQLPRTVRFTATLTALGGGILGHPIGKFAQNFPPFIGLMAFGDSDQTVRDAYLGWLAARRAAGDITAISDAFASAIAVILGSGEAEQGHLVSLLGQMAANFDKQSDELLIFDDNSPYSGVPYVTESAQSGSGVPDTILDFTSPPAALNFMSAVALAWWFSKTQADAGNPVPQGFPIPPPAGTALPAATIPAAVIEAADGDAPPQVIPIGALPPLPDPLPDEIDLFASSAPGKPANPPDPISTVRWLFSEAVAHSGNIFGDSGTDTIHAGKTVSGRCVILGIKLQLIDEHGVPLGDIGTTTTVYQQPQANIDRPDASVGWPFTAGARILSGGTSTTDETVTVHWWYDVGRACRYRIGYLVQGTNCSL